MVLLSICLLHECNTEFLVWLIAIVLSNLTGMQSSFKP